MSSSSHNSGGSSFGSFSTRILCECGMQSRYRISQSLKNPNRPFLRCPKNQGSQCKFFKWVDELDSGEIRKLLEVDFGYDNQKMLFEELVRVNQSQELQAKVLSLKAEKKRLKKDLMISRIIIFILVVVIISSKVIGANH